MSNKIDIAKKIQALAEKGVDGEKTTAEQKLREYMEKHGITDEQLNGIEEKWFVFDVPEKHYRLFNQIVCSICYPKPEYFRHKRTNKNNRNELHIKVEIPKGVEIELKYKIYLEHFAKEFDAFFLAYVWKNDLWSCAPANDADDISDEEKERYRKAAQMADGIDKQQIQKQIEK